MILRAVGPQNGGPDMQAGKDALHCQPVGGKLQEVGLRNLGSVGGRRPVGLVVDDPDRRRRPAPGGRSCRRCRSAGPRPSGSGTSATIATSARLSGPNSGANVGSRSTASVSSTMLLRTSAAAAAPVLATNASAAAAQAPRGSAGRCSSKRVGERAAQEAAVLGQRRRRQDGRLGEAAPAAAPPARPPHRSRAAPAARAPAALAISGSRGAGAPAQAGSGLDGCGSRAPCRARLGLGRLDARAAARRCGRLRRSPPARSVGEPVADQVVPAVGRRRRSGPRSPPRRAGRARASAPRRAGGCAPRSRPAPLRPWPAARRRGRSCP